MVDKVLVKSSEVSSVLDNDFQQAIDYYDLCYVLGIHNVYSKPFMGILSSS